MTKFNLSGITSNEFLFFIGNVLILPIRIIISVILIMVTFIFRVV